MLQRLRRVSLKKEPKEPKESKESKVEVITTYNWPPVRMPIRTVEGEFPLPSHNDLNVEAKALQEPKAVALPIKPTNTTFHRFPTLPPELQLLIWEKAIENCYIIFVEIEKRRVPPSGLEYVRNETLGLDPHRHTQLMLACKLAHEVVSWVDREERKERRYWRRWRRSEMIAFREWCWREEIS